MRHTVIKIDKQEIKDKGDLSPGVYRIINESRYWLWQGNEEWC